MLCFSLLFVRSSCIYKIHVLIFVYIKNVSGFFHTICPAANELMEPVLIALRTERQTTIKISAIQSYISKKGKDTRRAYP